MNRRRQNGFGLSPLAWSEIDAFLRWSGLHLATWEVELLERLDDTFVRVIGDDAFQWTGE